MDRAEQIEKAATEALAFFEWLAAYTGADTDNSTEAMECREKLRALRDALAVEK